MDRERKKRLQTIRLIITEIAMVLAVITTVIVLTFVAMGYNVNKDGVLDQASLVQIKSFPTGAIVQIDGEIFSARTNMSKMIEAGHHNVILSKTGYDTWEKEIETESGRLLKLDYPRLFYQNREPETVKDFGETISFFLPSPNREKIIFSSNATDKWSVLNIPSHDEEVLDVSKYLNQKTITAAHWNKNSDKLLVEAVKDNVPEWIVINTRNIEKSVDLSSDYGIKFSNAQFIGDSGDKIATLENGNLRTLTVSERSLSQIIATNVKSFINHENNLLYLTNGNELKLYQEGADDVLVAEYPSEVHFTLSSYLNRKYLAVTYGNSMEIYEGNYAATEDPLGSMRKVLSETLSWSPDTIENHSEGELIIASRGSEIASFDAELEKLSVYKLEGESFYFLDNYLIGTNSDSKMIIRDFDGTNRRDLTKATSKGIISKDNKYLYYLNTANNHSEILREKIVE